MKNTIVGCDFSLTCPCLCIHSGKDTFEFRNCSWFFLNSTKKYIVNLPNIRSEKFEVWETDEERYDWASDRLIGRLLSGHYKVYLEGYSFGSKGLTFNISEATGLFKHKMYKEGIEFETVPPTTNKKFASGKGNIDKIGMYNAFYKETSMDLETILNSQKHSNPISDMVDAYFLCKYGFLKEYT